MDRSRLRTHAHVHLAAPQARGLQRTCSSRAVRVSTAAAAPEAKQQASISELAALAARGRFFLSAEEVQQLEDAAGDRAHPDAVLLSMLEEASQSSRPPISHYKVGAVGRGRSGAVYIGVNLEFPGNPLGQSVHAEQFLVANLLLHGEQELDTLAISAAPCGHCRQFFSELNLADSIRFVFGWHGHAKPEIFRLCDLLPARFEPEDLLGDEKHPLLLQPQQHDLTWSSKAQTVLHQRADDNVFQQAASEALSAAQKSYSPYTHCPSAVAIINKQGMTSAGGYMESAAHNPGIPPLQSAIISAIIQGRLDTYQQVKELVLVEVAGGLVKHERIVKAIVASICEDITVSVLPVHRQ